MTCSLGCHLSSTLELHDLPATGHARRYVAAIGLLTNTYHAELSEELTRIAEHSWFAQP